MLLSDVACGHQCDADDRMYAMRMIVCMPYEAIIVHASWTNKFSFVEPSSYQHGTAVGVGVVPSSLTHDRSFNESLRVLVLSSCFKAGHMGQGSSCTLCSSEAVKLPVGVAHTTIVLKFLKQICSNS